MDERKTVRCGGGGGNKLKQEQETEIVPEAADYGSMMTSRSDRRGLKPDHPWPFWPSGRLAPRARIFIMALEHKGSYQRPEIRLQSDPPVHDLSAEKRSPGTTEGKSEGLLSSAMIVCAVCRCQWFAPPRQNARH